MYPVTCNRRRSGAPSASSTARAEPRETRPTSTGFNGRVSNVSLERIDATNWREALEVRVADEQLPFVADHQPVALVILAKSYIQLGGHRWEPLLIGTDAGAVVGVLALEHKPAEPCEIRNFAIDIRSQSRGIGTAATRAVISRAARGESDCVQLAVSAHPDNHAAHHVYQTAGFQWDGELPRERAADAVLDPSTYGPVADEAPIDAGGGRRHLPVMLPSRATGSWTIGADDGLDEPPDDPSTTNTAVRVELQSSRIEPSCTDRYSSSSGSFSTNRIAWPP